MSNDMIQKATAQPAAKADAKTSMQAYIKQMQGEIKKALPAVMTPERFTRIVLSALSTNPKLAVSTVQFDNSQNGNVIGFPKGETELVDAVNKIIDEVLEQGLYDQWLEEATAEAENLGL